MITVPCKGYYYKVVEDGVIKTFWICTCGEEEEWVTVSDALYLLNNKVLFGLLDGGTGMNKKAILDRLLSIRVNISIIEKMLKEEEVE